MNGKPTLLIVDDDSLVTVALQYVLGQHFEIRVAQSRADAVELVRAWGSPPELALIDLGLPPTPHRPDQGFLLIAELLAHSPEIRILVLSGQNDSAHARHACALGAIEFIAKPCPPSEIRSRLLHALTIHESEPVPESPLLGDSPPMEAMRQQVRQYADAPFPVLISGESGSGKELVARSLHFESLRSAQPYLTLNCAALSPTLIEPTLFGHAKGAFTGAVSAQAGYFEDAGAGTLFLDEIGELPIDLQAKLLRVLENGEYSRVGETRTRESRARVIAATNRDLRAEISHGRFRADLFHRITVFTIAVPPLRDLAGDKRLLLDHYRTRYAGRGEPFSFDDEAARLWDAYPFPGNVRELRNIVIRLATKHSGKIIGVAELEPELDPLCQDLPDSFDNVFEAARRHLLLGRNFNLDETLRNWEKDYIEEALALTQGNVSRAAKLLGMSRTTLYGRMGSKGGEL